MTEGSDNIFDGPAQLGFDLGEQASAPPFEPDREEVRRELQGVLNEARCALTECPWDERTLQYHKVVFPQMANWLPADERDQMRFDFAKEIKRIELLFAA